MILDKKQMTAAELAEGLGYSLDSRATRPVIMLYYPPTGCWPREVRGG